MHYTLRNGKWPSTPQKSALGHPSTQTRGANPCGGHSLHVARLDWGVGAGRRTQAPALGGLGTRSTPKGQPWQSWPGGVVPPWSADPSRRPSRLPGTRRNSLKPAPCIQDPGSADVEHALVLGHSVGEGSRPRAPPGVGCTARSQGPICIQVPYTACIQRKWLYTVLHVYMEGFPEGFVTSSDFVPVPGRAKTIRIPNGRAVPRFARPLPS